jgi:hypothetical protein
MKISNKIPKFWQTDNHLANSILQTWCGAAINISMEYGIYVEVVWKLGDDHLPNHIWFEVMGHQFESLIDLQRALKLKAFL